MKRITANTIETIATKLRRLPAVKKPPDYSRLEALELLRAELSGLQKRGYTVAQIAKTLRDEGLDVDAAAVRGALADGVVTAPARAVDAAPARAVVTAPARAVDKPPARAQRVVKKPVLPVKKPVLPVKRAKKATPARGAAVKSGTRRGMFELKPDTEDL